MSSGKQDDVDLPVGWWEHLTQYWQKWNYPDLEGFCGDPPTLSSKTLYRAKIKGTMKRRTLDRLLLKVKNDFSTTIQMLAAWNEDLVPKPGTAIAPIAQEFTLSTKRDMPQWADHRMVYLKGQRLRTLSCVLQTSIQTQDANLVFHIGRNDWDRPNIGIAKNDVFFTWYANGISPEEDKRLFPSASRLTATFEVKVHDDYVADFSVNGIRCLHRPISSAICRKLAVLAWGDRTAFSVGVRNFFVTTAEVQ